MFKVNDIVIVAGVGVCEVMHVPEHNGDVYVLGTLQATRIIRSLPKASASHMLSRATLDDIRNALASNHRLCAVLELSNQTLMNRLDVLTGRDQQQSH